MSKAQKGLEEVQQKQREVAMFGETIYSMMVAYKSAYDEGDIRDMSIYAMGILSDAQHVMEHNPEQARQFINKAKYFMSEIHNVARAV